MAIDDIYSAGIASGWKVTNASTLKENVTLEADVVIVGTGAGGGTAAEILSQAGLKVLMIEEGPLKTAADFKAMDELRAFTELYQEGAGRATSDGAIAILQGRTVGGTTTVNYTSSFRTPEETLKRWGEQHGVKGASVAEMAPWFEKMEQRLSITPWAVPPNENNAALKRAAEKLGWEWHVIPRNVRGCWNTGYCGLGCPVNAKQSMLVSTIPAALATGAELVHHLRVQKIGMANARASGLDCVALGADGITPTGVRVSVTARHYVLAGGAINTPALLLRSGTPDPHQRVGKRTTLHPVTLTVAEMPERVDPYYGAPQSIASDHFLWSNDEAREPGFKIEVPPIFPGIGSSIFARHGTPFVQAMAQLPFMQFMVVLLRDGFHAECAGGDVRISEDGSPILDYEISDYLWRGARSSILRMAEAQFAAGAKRVLVSHTDAEWCDSWEKAKAQIEQLPMKKFRTTLFTAHQMGGCAMGDDPRQAVVNSTGRHHQLENLSVFDGSVFPTSIGANPQLSIYGMTAKNATVLAAALKTA